jgi:hypothetical protein
MKLGRVKVRSQLEKAVGLLFDSERHRIPKGWDVTMDTMIDAAKNEVVLCARAIKGYGKDAPYRSASTSIGLLELAHMSTIGMSAWVEIVYWQVKFLIDQLFPFLPKFRIRTHARRTSALPGPRNRARCFSSATPHGRQMDRLRLEKAAGKPNRKGVQNKKGGH